MKFVAFGMLMCDHCKTEDKTLGAVVEITGEEVKSVGSERTSEGGLSVKVQSSRCTENLFLCLRHLAAFCRREAEEASEYSQMLVDQLQEEDRKQQACLKK